MKKVFQLTVFLILIASCSKEEPQINVGGDWKGILNLTSNSTCPGQFSLSLNQNGNALTGSIDLQQFSTVALIPNVTQRVSLTGSLDKTLMTLSYNSGLTSIKLSATILGNSFSGNFSQTNGFRGCGDSSATDKDLGGTWSGTKQ